MPALSETETTIRWDREEQVAHIWTNDPKYIRKLDGLCAECPNDYRLVREHRDGRFFDAPARLIRFGKPFSESRRKQLKQASAKTRFSASGAVCDRDEIDSTDTDG